MKTEITAIILACDEAFNIARAIKSLRGCCRILVMDSGSQDGTPDIARSLGAEVIVTDWPGFAQQRRRALSLVDGEWILFLDADEALDDDLRQSLISFTPGARVDGYYLKRENYFSGRRLKHSRWENDWQLRLFRRSQAAISSCLVHEGVAVAGRTERFTRGHIEHYTAADIGSYLGKLMKYALLEAEEKHSRSRRISFPKMIFDLLSEFWKIYIHHQGFRDGWRGYALAQLMAFYKFTVDAGIWESSSKVRDGG